VKVSLLAFPLNLDCGPLNETTESKNRFFFIDLSSKIRKDFSFTFILKIYGKTLLPGMTFLLK